VADRALTEEAMLAGLHDIRLPGEASGGLAAELLAAAGIGIFAALLAAALLMLVTGTRRDATAVSETPAGEIDAGGAAARRRALLRRLKREDPERFAALAGDLYRPGGLPDLAALEAAVRS
jgi:hypothetical protein